MTSSCERRDSRYDIVATGPSGRYLHVRRELIHMTVESETSRVAEKRGKDYFFRNNKLHLFQAQRTTAHRDRGSNIKGMRYSRLLFNDSQ